MTKLSGKLPLPLHSICSLAFFPFGFPVASSEPHTQHKGESWTVQGPCRELMAVPGITFAFRSYGFVYHG